MTGVHKAIHTLVHPQTTLIALLACLAIGLAACVPLAPPAMHRSPVSLSARDPLQTPNYLAAGLHGELYLTDARTNRVVALAPTGKPLAILEGTKQEGIAIHQPEGIAVDSQGNIYLANTGRCTIEKISSH